MIWFEKENPLCIYADNRTLETILCDGRVLNITPDFIYDFRTMPFQKEIFNLVVFDPPHLRHAGKNSWIANKYGLLSSDWRSDLKLGFDECFRVLKPFGTLIFKWNEDQIKLSEILPNIGHEPLFGNRRSKTHWIVFMKYLNNELKVGM